MDLTGREWSGGDGRAHRGELGRYVVSHIVDIRRMGRRPVKLKMEKEIYCR